MNAPALPGSSVRSLADLHAAFLTILPRIELHGRCYFRHKKGEKRDEAICEMIALAWKWFVTLAERGKDATQFASALASFAARAVNSGRRLCGQERAADVLSPLAQQQIGFTVTSFPDGSSLSDNVFSEALIDNTQTPVPEQVAFRLDFPAWRLSRSERDRRLLDDLMLGERTKDVAEKYGLTWGRISQLRRDFHQDWLRYCDPEEAAQQADGEPRE
jgi:hypothetical protein